MTSLSFTMTPEEYYRGFKFKSRQNRSAMVLMPIVSVLISVVLIVLYFFLWKEQIMPFFAAVLIIFPSSSLWIEKKTIKAEYMSSHVMSGEHTVRLHEDGIEFFGGFEKIFVKWDRLTGVKDTGKELILIPCRRTGAFVISKSRYAGEELNAVLSDVHEKAAAFRGEK